MLRQLRTKGLWTFFICVVNPPSPSQSQCCVLFLAVRCRLEHSYAINIDPEGGRGRAESRGRFLGWGGLEFIKLDNDVRVSIWSQTKLKEQVVRMYGSQVGIFFCALQWCLFDLKKVHNLLSEVV